MLSAMRSSAGVMRRSGSAAAAPSNLQPGADAGSRPVVAALTLMSAAITAAGPGLCKVHNDLVLRGQRLAVKDFPKS